ncbi:MAG: hypothetical protein HOO91_14300 [Bacteroidales bacterium]|nr:hypothetical protein [Bacteroidales bacterium]
MDIDKLKVKDLIRGITNLSLGSIVSILSFLLSILIGSFSLGQYYAKLTFKSEKNNYPIEMIDDDFLSLQNRIKNTPAIKVFESNRNSLKNEKWIEAYSTFSSYMQNYLAPSGPDFLKYHYRMLNKYSSKLYIPINVSDSKVEYFVYFEYSDVRPILSEFESLITRPIEDVLSAEQIKKLKHDIVIELPKHYIIKDSIEIANYVNNCFKILRYRDLVSKRFSLIDEIGRKNNLEPIYVKPLAQGDYRDSECEAYSKLTLIKEGNDWKVEEFNTMLISRKNE